MAGVELDSGAPAVVTAVVAVLAVVVILLAVLVAAVVGAGVWSVLNERPDDAVAASIHGAELTVGELNDILTVAIKGGASDIHLKAGLPPMFRIDGSLVPLKDARRLPPEEVGRMAFSIMNNYQKEEFKQENEIDLAYGVPGLGRFRVNVFMQRGTVGIVFRVIPFKILTIQELNLPPVLEKVASEAEFTPRDILTPEERVKRVFAVDIALEAGPGLLPGVPAEAVLP